MNTKTRKKRSPRQEAYWSARRGLGEWTPEDKAEVERRTAEVLAIKQASSDNGSRAERQGTGVCRVRSNGGKRRGYGVSHGD